MSPVDDPGARLVTRSHGSIRIFTAVFAAVQKAGRAAATEFFERGAQAASHSASWEQALCSFRHCDC